MTWVAARTAKRMDGAPGTASSAYTSLRPGLVDRTVSSTGEGTRRAPSDVVSKAIITRLMGSTFRR